MRARPAARRARCPQPAPLVARARHGVGHQGTPSFQALLGSNSTAKLRNRKVIRMNYAIASDLHGSAYWTRKFLDAAEAEGFDRLILLGDILYHGPRNDLPRDYAPKEVIELLRPYAARIVCCRGNCEAEVDQTVLPFACMSDYVEVVDEGRVLHASHGHHENPEHLPALTAGSAFLYGHTHIKDHHTTPEGIEIFNPGSTSLPKDGSHSYGVYRDGAFSYRILEG
jgi:hypothetical protein